MNPDLLVQTIESVGALIFFGVMFLGAFCFLFLLGMLLVLGARAGWRRLSRLTWNRVVVSLEQRALRGR